MRLFKTVSLCVCACVCCVCVCVCTLAQLASRVVFVHLALLSLLLFLSPSRAFYVCVCVRSGNKEVNLRRRQLLVRSLTRSPMLLLLMRSSQIFFFYFFSAHTLMTRERASGSMSGRLVPSRLQLLLALMLALMPTATLCVCAFAARALAPLEKTSPTLTRAAWLPR